MPRQTLDARDIAILRVLSREGRISKADLADRVNLSATPCWQRLKRLEESGLIQGYHADLALGRIAPHIVVFVTVELDSHRAETFQKFEREMARFTEITGCWALGGGFDYLMQVTTRDIESYQILIDALLEAHVGLKRYYSYIVTKEVPTSGGPPLDHLLGAEPQKV